MFWDDSFMTNPKTEKSLPIPVSMPSSSLSFNKVEPLCSLFLPHLTPFPVPMQSQLRVLVLTKHSRAGRRQLQASPASTWEGGVAASSKGRTGLKPIHKPGRKTGDKEQKAGKAGNLYYTKRSCIVKPGRLQNCLQLSLAGGCFRSHWLHLQISVTKSRWSTS